MSATFGGLFVVARRQTVRLWAVIVLVLGIGAPFLCPDRYHSWGGGLDTRTVSASHDRTSRSLAHSPTICSAFAFHVNYLSDDHLYRACSLSLSFTRRSQKLPGRLLYYGRSSCRLNLILTLTVQQTTTGSCTLSSRTWNRRLSPTEVDSRA